jgi:hypothetical protein
MLVPDAAIAVIGVDTDRNAATGTSGTSDTDSARWARSASST